MREFTRLPSNAPIPEALLWDLFYGWGNLWSLRPAFLAALLYKVREARGPILECGSGLSTLLVGLVAKDKGVEVWTLEHDPFWAGEVRKALARYDVEGVKVCETPLREYGEFLWYDPPKGEMPANFALVVCDGPPGGTPGGRYGLMPVMREHLGGALVFLDDAGRAGERDAMARWAREFGATYTIEGVERPYSVIRVPSSLTSPPSPRHSGE
jgi:hypothetical protein